ncbi:MAG: TIGR01212 family radical SAM protein [Clostridiales bacterium]|nr:TIGR01212 family radical SAM protein [Clostridiales bacterium]
MNKTTKNGKILWDNKRFHSLDYHMKQTYGQKIYKLSLNGGMSCPNRDGTIDTKGCIFCSKGGSGDFAASNRLTITEQIEEAKQLISAKIKADEIDRKYIAYFQAFTNTHGPVDYLRRIFTEAIMHPDILILSIATRPDCLGDDVLKLLNELNQIKPVWIELGLQTIHEKTEQFIRRGYPLSAFETALKKLNQLDIPVIVHTILGLPGENPADILLTMNYIGGKNIQGIKLQLLHILKGTDLGTLYETGKLKEVLTLEAYVDLVITCLEHLPKEIIVHRITGDGPKSLLLAPNWSGNKKLVLNRIQQEMKKRNTWQGRCFY